MADTLPTISSISLNKSAYAKGETMILTIDGFDPDEETLEVTVTLKSTGSGATSTPQKVTSVIDELDGVVTDSGGRTWTKQSRVGSTFTYSAVA